MKHLLWISFFFVCSSSMIAQKITYSELNKKETANMFFEILGRYGSDCIIYKNISKEHYLARYDQEMRLSAQRQLDFIPEKAFNLDFINYGDFLIGVYQYQKNNIVSCYAFKLGSDLSEIDRPIVIDTARIGFYADNKIYNLTFSENKQQLLVYKRILKNEVFTQVTKTFTPTLQITDSSRFQYMINSRKEDYGEPVIDNEGNILMCHTYYRSQKYQSDSLNLLMKKNVSASFESYAIDLQHLFIESPVIKTDQLNKKYLINAYASTNSKGEPEGLYSAVLDFTGRKFESRFNVFSAAAKKCFDMPGNREKETFELTPRNIVLKKNNGFMLMLESGYDESYNNSGNYSAGYPYGFANDYYYYDPYSYRYRPWGSSSYYQQTRFHRENIVVLNVDSALNLVTQSVINKKQMDVETDNYLSFSNFTARNELHFLFLERDQRRDVISDHVLLTDGQVKRNPTISSNETNNEFMPRLGKQISSRQIIIPFSYLNKIGFAKIEWP